MLKGREWITEQVDEANLIDPFIDHKVITNEVMAYGLDTYSYIFRVSGLWRPVNKRKNEGMILDPKQIDKEMFNIQPGVNGVQFVILLVTTGHFGKDVIDIICTTTEPKSSM